MSHCTLTRDPHSAVTLLKNRCFMAFDKLCLDEGRTTTDWNSGRSVGMLSLLQPLEHQLRFFRRMVDSHHASTVLRMAKLEWLAEVLMAHVWTRADDAVLMVGMVHLDYAIDRALSS